MVDDSRTRVLIVDDSAVIGAVVSRTLKEHDDLEVVGIAVDGAMGVESVKNLKPDIVILDIEMPVMDGITALPLMLKENPNLRVLICSTLSARGADITIRALSLGAVDCLLKPGAGSIISAKEFQDDLVRRIRSIANKPSAADASAPSSVLPTGQAFSLRDSKPIIPPKVIAIGSSTGGPKVLMEVLKHLQDMPVPIVVTQHMPKTFTALLAEHISESCGLVCTEGKDGDVLQPGHVYVAPGGFHMMFKKDKDGVVIKTTEDPPENFCRPAVDPMLRSLISIYGAHILTMILTGMGNDGLESCKALVEKGGHVIAQDKETSVVWGMPGAVAEAGLCSAVLPKETIHQWIVDNVKRA